MVSAMPSHRADAEAKASQDLIADRGRGQIAQTHPEHQGQRELDAPSRAVNAAFDSLGRALAANHKRSRPLPALRHPRGKETRTDHAYSDPLRFEQRSQRFAIGTDASFARAIPRAIRQA